MKNKTFGKHGVLALVVALAVSGCAQKPQVSGEIIDEEPVPPVVERPIVVPADDPAEDFSAAPDPLDERVTDGLLQRRAVYFAYDKSVVREEYLPLIEAHTGYLLSNPDKGALLEGNTDSRGSTEYNLALGQRRANAVRDIMSAGGVSEAQLEALSYGEGEPRALGNTEAAWAENRRVDIRYRDE
ncbi:MAG: OmpA family protein [Gammaproteobacteria bacterium]